jgi:saccharopine dehydrogenase-like NADP-dependent oxidoreductase
MSPDADEERELLETGTVKGKSVRLPSLFAYARGLKEGREKAVGVTVAAGVGGGMGGATGIPMAIGLKLMNSGKIKGPGVFSPEQVINPDNFFNELGPLCTIPSAKANAEEMLIITSS